MSYVNKKIRLFKEAGDTEIHRKRSEGRMKTYHSATDARAWCGAREERRQHILDLVRQGDGKGLSLGKYIPIEAIIDILLASKNADIRRLQAEIEFLKKLIRDKGLSVPEFVYEDKPPLGAGNIGGEQETGVKSDDDSEAKAKIPATIDETDEEQEQAIINLGGKDSRVPGKDSRVSGKSSHAGEGESSETGEEGKADNVPGKDSKGTLKGKDSGPISPQMAATLAAIEKLENIKGITKDEDTGKTVPLQLPEFEEGDPLQDEFKQRVEKLQNLEDDVRALKTKGDKTVQAAGDTDDRDKLLAKIAKLEKEICDLKHNLKEMEILRVERNCLKMRVEDLCKVQRDYEELLRKTQGFEALKAECATYKAKCEELKDLEAEVKELRLKCQRIEELENERKLMMKEIQDCECCMNNQEDEIKRLACHIDCLTKDLDQRQDQMKVKVITMRAHLEKKDTIIAKSEEQLATVQDQLRNSIESLSCETLCLRNHIEDLEGQISQYEDKIKEYENKIAQYEEKMKELESNNSSAQSKFDEYEQKISTYESKLKSYEDIVKESQKKVEEYEKMNREYEKTIKEYEKTIKELESTVKECERKMKDLNSTLLAKDQQNKTLSEKLETEKAASRKLEEALAKAIISDDHLKQLLKQSKCAIKCITQKLEKYTLVDMSKLDLERENYIKKINELEGALRNLASGDGSEQSAQLQEELNNNLAKMKEMTEENERLQRLLQQLQEVTGDEDRMTALIEENETLRKLVKELQESAKEPPMEDDCEALRQALTEKEQIIDELASELARVKEELEKQKQLPEGGGGVDNSSEIDKLKAEINILNAEIDRLNFDLDNSRRKSEVLEQAVEGSAGVNALETENANLKAKISELMAKEEELKTEIARLEKENQLLKAEMDKLMSAAGPTDAINKLKDEINKLQHELDAKDKENKDLKDEINRLKQGDVGKEGDEEDKEIQDLKDQINKLQQELASKGKVDTDNASLRDEINRLKQELADKENIAKDLKDQINKLQQQASSSDSGKGSQELQNEIDRLKQELSQLKSSEQSKDADADFAKERDELMKQIEAQKKEISDLLNKIKEPASGEDDAMSKALEEKNKEISSLKDTIAALEKQLKDLQGSDKGELQNQMNENEKLRNIIADLQNQLKALKEASPEKGAGEKELNEENEKLKNTIADLELQLKNLKNAQLDAIPKGSPEIEKVMDDLRQSLEKEEQKSKELEGLLKKCMEEGQALKNRINELEGAEAKPNEAGDNYQKRIQELEAELEKKTKEYNDLLASLDNDEPGSEEDWKKRCLQLEASLSKQKDECNQMLTSLKEHYDRDIKNLQRRSEAAIDKVQEAQQEVIKRLSKQHDEEIASIKSELSQTKRSLASIPEEDKLMTAAARKLDVDLKEDQVSVRTFDEVCICSKLPAVIPISTPTQQSTPRAAQAPVQARAAFAPLAVPEFPSGRSAMPPSSIAPRSMNYAVPEPPQMTRQPIMQGQPSPAAEERLHSIKKLVELENKLLVKQHYTKHKIDQLQNTVDQLKRELELEKQRNGDLQSRYSNQSKTVENMKVEIDLVKKENFEDKRQLQHLNSTLQNVLQGQRMLCSCPIGTGHVNIPHFHTELSYMKMDDNKYKHNCVMKKGVCSCSSGERSLDSFEIEE